jgi:hypothetical protein
MATDGTEIDLYADDLGEEFNQVCINNNHINHNGTAHHVNANDSSANGLNSSGLPSKKIGIYVGNLSWVSI